MDEGQRGAAQRSIEVDNSRSVADAQNHTIHDTGMLASNDGKGEDDAERCDDDDHHSEEVDHEDHEASHLNNVVAMTRPKVMMMKQ